MIMTICIKCPPMAIIDTLNTLQEEIMVVEVETHMSLPMVMDTNPPNPPGGGHCGHHGTPSGGDGGL